MAFRNPSSMSSIHYLEDRLSRHLVQKVLHHVQKVLHHVQKVLHHVQKVLHHVQKVEENLLYGIPLCM